MAGWVDTGQGYLASTDLTRSFLEAAQPQVALADFVTPLDQTNAVGGDTIQFPKIYDLDDPIDTSSLSERGDIPSADYTRNKGTLIQREYGLATDSTEKLDKTAAYDVNDIGLNRLKNHMVRKVNRLIAAAFKQTYVKYAPNNAAAGHADSWKRDGTLPNAATRDFAAIDLDAIKDYMMDVLHVPTWSGEGAGNFDYIVVLTHSAYTKIIRDTEVRQDLRYSYTSLADSSPLIAKSQGIWNRLLFKVDNDAFTLGLGAAQAYKGEALVFGDKPVVSATKTAPEIRKETKYFGRLRKVAWYGYFGYAHNLGSDSIDLSQNQARVVHVTSA